MLWSIFDAVRGALKSQGLITHAMMFSQLATQITERKHPPFDFAVMDEAQDVSIAQLRFLAAMGSWRADALFFAGDLGQRIFQQPFSWKSMGRGYSRAFSKHASTTTSHQIRMQADRLLGPEVSDVDGNTEDRRGTVSVFNGTAPVIKSFGNQAEEINAVGEWLMDRSNEGIGAHEIGVFVRSDAELDRASAAVSKAGLPFKVLDER
ncbi:MAG: hypothetical protein IPN81_06915 [Nitrosomonadales bacterium]|nr:hypothetical protein [Nitrosomonadales bacterium]